MVKGGMVQGPEYLADILTPWCIRLPPADPICLQQYAFGILVLGNVIWLFWGWDGKGVGYSLILSCPFYGEDDTDVYY